MATQQQRPASSQSSSQAQAQQYQAGGSVKTAEDANKKKNPVLIGILLLALILLAVYGYYWGQSDSGQRTLTRMKELFLKYNPMSLYMRSLSQAQDVGTNTWTSAPNRTSSQRGLVFKDFKVTSTEEIPQGAPISFAYILELQNIQVENMPIRLQCGLKNKPLHSKPGEMEAGIKVVPTNANGELVVSGNRIYDDVRCVVSPTVTRLLEGANTFVGSVSFPFKTKDVVLPVYFITEDVYRNLEGRDFFSHFSIDEKTPIRATYNGEPIEVGIGVSTENKQPVVIGRDRTPLIGITLQNRWNGHLSKLMDLTLEVPKEMTLSPISQPDKKPNALCPFVLAGTGSRTNLYRIDDGIKSNVRISRGRLRTFECWFNVNEDMIQSNAFYTKRFYKVNADYEYHLQNETETVTVKKITTGAPTSIITTELGIK